MHLAVCVAVLGGCKQDSPGSPEAIADAFAQAYFVEANQEKAKEYTAFGATKMLDQEIADVGPLRESGYTPNAASLNVSAKRGDRSMRGKRVRFDYVIRYRSADGSERRKHADIELADVEGAWRVVRLGLEKAGARPPSATE